MSEWNSTDSIPHHDWKRHNLPELKERCDNYGAKYLPIDTLVNWMNKQIQRNGKRVRKLLDELAKEGFLILHKRNTTASLNPGMKAQIVEYIEKNL